MKPVQLLIIHNSNIMFQFFYHFFFNDTATTEIYTLSLHDALPIWRNIRRRITIPLTLSNLKLLRRITRTERSLRLLRVSRSEERFSRNAETDLVCRLLLEKKKKKNIKNRYVNIIIILRY